MGVQRFPCFVSTNELKNIFYTSCVCRLLLGAAGGWWFCSVLQWFFRLFYYLGDGGWVVGAVMCFALCFAALAAACGHSGFRASDAAGTRGSWANLDETWTSASRSHQIVAALLNGRSGDGGGQDGAMAAVSGRSSMFFSFYFFIWCCS
jgi:hypothetical protein